MRSQPAELGFYLCRFSDERYEVSTFWTGDRWEYRLPNGTVYPVEPLSWRPFPEWNRDLPVISYVENSERPRRLAELYRKAGRDRPDHPLHGLFTGLAEEARQCATGCS